MPEETKRGEEYIRKVQDDSRHFAEGLLAENEKLRSMATALERENTHLEQQLLLARQDFAQRETEQIQMKQQMIDIEMESRRLADQYNQVEQQNSNMANLYVASYRLHGTLDREEVLATIQEILINLVGSEEIGIFEMDTKHSELVLASSFGIDAKCYRTIPLGSGVIGRVAVTGEAYLVGQGNRGGESPDESNLTACIPLKVDGQVMGAIAVFQLLQQKSGFEPVDQELFDLLATHAGMALYCTGLHARICSGSAKVR